ncbi:hypothetical protein PWT90_03753 [Aphanocladium album]|nr:hypothetical protein PWT90_03753 [Aphanocladium album]
MQSKQAPSVGRGRHLSPSPRPNDMRSDDEGDKPEPRAIRRTSKTITKRQASGLVTDDVGGDDDYEGLDNHERLDHEERSEDENEIKRSEKGTRKSKSTNKAPATTDKELNATFEVTGAAKNAFMANMSKRLEGVMSIGAETEAECLYSLRQTVELPEHWAKKKNLPADMHLKVLTAHEILLREGVNKSFEKLYVAARLEWIIAFPSTSDPDPAQDMATHDSRTPGVDSPAATHLIIITAGSNIDVQRRPTSIARLNGPVNSPHPSQASGPSAHITLTSDRSSQISFIMNLQYQMDFAYFVNGCTANGNRQCVGLGLITGNLATHRDIQNQGDFLYANASPRLAPPGRNWQTRPATASQNQYAAIQEQNQSVESWHAPGQTQTPSFLTLSLAATPQHQQLQQFQEYQKLQQRELERNLVCQQGSEHQRFYEQLPRQQQQPQQQPPVVNQQVLNSPRNKSSAASP